MSANSMIVRGEISSVSLTDSRSRKTKMEPFQQQERVRCANNRSSSKCVDLDAKTRLKILFINREKKNNNQIKQKVINNETEMSSSSQLFTYITFFSEIIVRAVLYGIFQYTENATPFERTILLEERWLYRYPYQEKSYVPTSSLWIMVYTTPAVLLILVLCCTKGLRDFWQGLMTITLILPLNGIITNMIKIVVGRPRPDFFSRCFPNNEIDNFQDFIFKESSRCTGDEGLVRDGRKSFPSGHSSFTFASFVFVALYLAGKLHTFDKSKKQQAWKFCLFLIPLMAALCVALSRTCDYHHHWQDVTVGSLLGLVISYSVYRYYYPALDSKLCHKSYSESTHENLINKSKIKSHPV